MDKKIGIILIGIIAIIGTFVAVQLIREEPEPEPEPEIPEVEAYELTINIEGQGETEPIEGTHTYEEGTEITLTATPDEDWYFEEWTGDIEGTEEEITVTMDSDKEITAHFTDEEIVYYDLEIDIDGEGTTDPEEGTHTYQEGEEVSVSAFPEEDWYFEEWTGDIEGTEEEITVTMDSDKEITAHFTDEEIVYYDLEIDIDGEGTTDPEEGTHTYQEGEEVSVSAFPEEGWYFEEWTGDCTGTTCTVTMDEDKEVTAHFTEDVPEEYDLTINVEGQGVIVPEEGTHTYEEGTEITLTATPDEDWYFEEWTGDHEATEEQITIILTDNKELTAKFTEDLEEQIELGIETIEGGTTDPEPDTYYYEEGEEITVEAISDDGWNFTEWYLEGSATQCDQDEKTCTFTINEDSVLSAFFSEEVSYTEINTCSELEDINEPGYYELGNNIDCSGINNFDPIGSDNENRFQGVFDGQGYKVENLQIDRPEESHLGLFGVIGSDAEIKNVRMKNVDIQGYESLGGLVGWNQGEVKNSYASGTIKGPADSGSGGIGGLVGENGMNALIKNSHSSTSVTGIGLVGGLIGDNAPTSAEIENSYATGEVEAETYPEDAGGLTGRNGGTIRNSFSDQETTNQDQAIGQGSGDAEALPTSEMQDKSTYTDAGWDFEEIWTMIEYPELQ